MFVALIEPGLTWSSPPVPFASEAGLVETGLLNDAGDLRACPGGRPALSSQDFARILDRGLVDAEIVLPRRDDEEQGDAEGFGETAQMPFEVERRGSICWCRARSAIVSSGASFSGL